MFSIETFKGITFIYQGLTLVTHRPLWQARNPFGVIFSIIKISDRRYNLFDEHDEFTAEVTTLEEAALWLIENVDEPW